MRRNFFKSLRTVKLFVLASFLMLLMGWFSTSPALASEFSFVTIVNPVRGKEFWGLAGQEPLTAVEAQKDILEKYDFSATWLLRPEAIYDREIANYFKALGKNHELGIFLEVTPIWADEAGIAYHSSVLWHYARSIFLSGYLPEERQKLIDAAFLKFNQVFGYFPKSVGAWHLDSSSLDYMQRRYQIDAALLCADQFSTDNYQLWGSWWGVPYYPSRNNVLMPAQSLRGKLDVVIFQWAARDPVNGYGGGGEESTFSVQANDYLKHDLETAYFSRLVDVYTQPKEARFGQITVGLENDHPWLTVGGEYANQIEALASKKLNEVTMAEFTAWYKERFPQVSPPHLIESNDLLGSGKKATWLMSPRGRVGILKERGESVIRDWRVYDENWPEPYLETANPSINLTISLPARIDGIRFPEKTQTATEGWEEITLSEPKPDLPFRAPWYIVWLVMLIFGVGMIIAFRLAKIFAFILALGSLAQTLTMIKSGWLYRFGMGFWGPNGHDGIWHLALIQALTRRWPPQNPVFASQPLSNYHYLFDLSVALVNRLTGLPVINLYFQIYPLILSLLLGFLTFLLVKKLTRGKMAPFLAVFFAYFGGSFGWLVTLLRGQGLGGESMFWASQSASLLINPPYVLSIVFILLGFYFYLNYLKKPDTKSLIILTLVFGSLVGIKAYAGVIILFGLGLTSVWEWGKEKKRITGRLFLTSLALSLVIFLPTNRAAASLFVLAPFWFPHTMLSFSDRFGWLRLDQARQAYSATGKWVRWFLAEGLGLVIFFIGNLGTRVIGVGMIFSWFKKFKKINSFAVLFLGCLASSAVIPLLVIQKGNPWNSIQFFYYFLFLMGIAAALEIGKFLEKRKKGFQVVTIGVLVLLTLPTTIGTIKHYWPYRAPARVSFGELEALDFLNKEKEGIVLTFPFDPTVRERFAAPQPLYAYETTAYVAALADKTTFLEDEMNLEIMGVDWRSRREIVEKFFKNAEPEEAKQFLKERKIGYLYLIEEQELPAGASELDLEKIFANGEVKIYRVIDY